MDKLQLLNRVLFAIGIISLVLSLIMWLVGKSQQVEDKDGRKSKNIKNFTITTMVVGIVSLLAGTGMVMYRKNKHKGAPPAVTPVSPSTVRP